MKASRSTLLFATLIGASGLLSCEADAPPTDAASAPAPMQAARRQSKLTLALVVDQLSLWEVVDRLPLLPPGGGLSRLAMESQSAVELRYGYVQTSTAMGHSALFTGLSPHESGITANEVLSETGAPMAIVSDRSTRLLAPGGKLDRPGASLAALAPGRETLADALRRQRPEVTIACLSMKDRGAVFACGRTPDISLWFDVRQDAFVTSTAFAEVFPRALESFGRPGVAAPYRVAPWVAKDERWLARHAPGASDIGQGNFERLGTTFPHERPCRPARRIYEAEITKKAREVAKEALGSGDWVLGTTEPFVVFTRNARELPAERLDRLVSAERAALMAMPGIAGVFDTRGSAARACPDEADDSMNALVCRSLAGDHNGSLLIVPEHGAFFDSGYVEGDGCNHGTPFLFDRTVPLLVRLPRSSADSGRRTSFPRFDPAARVDPRTHARTLAGLLSIAPPMKGGRDLSSE